MDENITILITGEVQDGRDAMELIAQLQPDVHLLDL